MILFLVKTVYHPDSYYMQLYYNQFPLYDDNALLGNRKSVTISNNLEYPQSSNPMWSGAWRQLLPPPPVKRQEKETCREEREEHLFSFRREEIEPPQ